MKKFQALVFLLILVLSCENDNKLADVTDQCEFPENMLGTCFYGLSGSFYDEIVITDIEAYKEFEDSIRIPLLNSDCDTAKLPAIDFNAWSLLAKRTQGGGCSASYDRKIMEDTCEKKLIYKITVEYSGICDMLLASWNWVYIPKLKNGYRVDFLVE